MTAIKNGGPAFPHDNQELGGMHRIAQPGMSLRDWFAGQALTGLLGPLVCASSEAINQAAKVDGFSGTFAEYLAKRAYEQADAMLATREVRS